MIAIRQIQDVISDTVTIKLPAHFVARRVEVIILPVEEGEQEERGELQRLLLAAPTLSEDELEGFALVRDWMSQWTVTEF